MRERSLASNGAATGLESLSAYHAVKLIPLPISTLSAAAQCCGLRKCPRRTISELGQLSVGSSSNVLSLA
jgi:hypothetical protein